MKSNLLITFFFLISITWIKGQDPVRRIPAVRATLPVKMDGVPNEAAWSTAAVIEDLLEQRPVFNRKEEYDTRTEARIMYDDNAVYISGFNHERRDSIATELVGRDKMGVNDFAGVVFDTYRDQINGVGFYVTSLGEQYDVKYSLSNEDDSWSTVYQTATHVTDSGWSFEMRIPYSALRFSKNKVQDWGFNFIRRRTKAGRQLSWNSIDPNKFGFMSQAGIWSGITDIKSPLRLSFSPYFSTYLNHGTDNNGKRGWSTSINGGMDVKYGISKGFTLDMTLIPDFGQVQSDNLILNLSPFEVRYNENRPFFTEGTELFNKGNLFYSRRIGAEPINASLPYDYLGTTGKILNNPRETKLVNATKVSGRTAKGLGIGFFNAITKPQYADIVDSTQKEMQVETSPLTNYNILVLDQTMKNNSSITLVNTNVLRSGSSYDANVTAGLFDLYDKKVAWNLWGKLANSRISGRTIGKTSSGITHELNIGKFKGPFNFEFHHYVADEKYEQNDLGYATNNNYNNWGGGAWYKINKPKHFYNNLYFNVGGTYSEMYKPKHFQYLSIYLNANGQLKNLWNVGMYGNINPRQQDFYETRSNSLRQFKTPSSWRIGGFVNTNQAKKYYVSADFSSRPAAKYKSSLNELYLYNQYRFNDKLNVGLNTNLSVAKNDAGFAFNMPGTIFFGLRNRRTVENKLSVKYNFNIKMGLTLQARHYWSKVDYFRYFTLKEDGYLQDVANVPIDPATGTSYNPDNNFNIFNIDMVYTWEFAQGSFINIAWKNAGQVFNRNVNDKYYKNLNTTLDSPHNNNFSVKVIYYLDYLTLKNPKRK